MLRTWHRPLVITGLLMALLLPITLAGLVFDDRVLVGAPIWLKPFKFSISLALYTLSLAWFLTFLRRGRRFGWWVGTVVSVSILIEMAGILTQVVRGKRSHFNIETPFDAMVLQYMGLTIIVLWLMHVAMAILMLCTGFADRALALAVRFGLGIAFLGFVVGFLMTQLQPGQNPKHGTVGAHSVGAPDGGAYMPVTGWSTEVGDLRVPHFIGLHAMQVLPLAVGLLGRRATARMAWVLGTGYLGLFLLAGWQALRGQSVLRPDAQTLGVFVLLVVLVALGVRWARQVTPVDCLV